MKNLFFSLLASLLLVGCCGEQSLSVIVENDVNFDRNNESVELPLAELYAKFGQDLSKVAVFENGIEIASQLTKDVLLFQASVAANSQNKYEIKINEVKTDFPSKVTGRLVPERKDDWSWENNVIAFRVYGPALEATGEISNGIDVWLKRTNELVIDKWYKNNVNYHVDHGEGMDAYKVGRTLGAGMLAPIVDGKFALGNNFITGTLLENGPIRTSVLLTYAPYNVGDVEVKETRVITLDAYSHFNKVTSTFSGDFEALPAAVGIILRGEGEEISKLDQAVAYSEPADPENGTTHIGVIMTDNCEFTEIDAHLAALTQVKNGEGVTFLTGAGWSKFGYANNASWKEEVVKQEIMMNNPLVVTIEK